MRTGTITPTISVEIGGQLRIYHAFVTTARPALDGPSTLTLYTSNFCGRRGIRGQPDPVQPRVRAEGRSHRARQRDGARVASGDVPEPALPLRARRRAAPWPAVPAAVAVAAPLHAAAQPRPRRDAEPSRLDRQSPRVQPPASRGLNSGGRDHAHVRQSGSQRSQRSRRQARGRGAPLRGWRARWPEADRVRRLGAARRRREERHVPGAPVHRPW